MIDLYVSSDKFIFRKGSKTYAVMLFSDLKLQQVPEAAKGFTADDQFDLNSLAEIYVPGQVIKGLDKQEVVLGPKREFTHEVTLHACGNPDMRQYSDIGPKTTVRVVGLEEAAAAVQAYQETYEMGGGNCAKEHGVVWELPKGGKGKRKKVGEVTYGGRYWTLAEKAAWEAEIKAKYATT